MTFKNLVGMKFGRLLVLEYIGKSKWKCLCDCGNTTIVNRGNLLSGNTKSCGCYHKERAKQANSGVFCSAKRPEVRIKNSLGHIGHKHTKEQIEKTIAKTTGLHRSNEFKKIMHDCHIGDKNPRWIDGRSFGKYCIKFNNAFKHHIRTIFENKCFVCGINELNNPGGQKLHVHHIDYNKNSLCTGKAWAFVPLCSSHHGNSNGKKWYWFNLLINYYCYNKDINFNNDINIFSVIYTTYKYNNSVIFHE